MSNTAQPAAAQRLILKSGIVSWMTTKTATGYSFRVSLIEYQKPTENLKTVDGLRSRAIAMSRAKQWVRYFKSCQRQGLLADKF